MLPPLIVSRPAREILPGPLADKFGMTASPSYLLKARLQKMHKLIWRRFVVSTDK